ncbi:MAG: chemotaxis response regulator protein-glutamate methylesterase [Planctomycetes bacterium]|nr:chemotaxis response regulator protein-glutamate methylesterase [Planctomycetota bacterium]
MNPIRVLVVDDSITIRKRLVEVLDADAGLQVVGEASDGREAIELCQELRPDAITMDMMLPVMTGLAATEYIMAYVPTPILIVSSSTNRGEVFRTYDALAAGAVDVFEKPSRDEPLEKWDQRLVSAVKMVARIKVITHPRARLGLSTGSRKLAHVLPETPKDARCRIVAIGASTGGPGALVEILRHLPGEFPVPIVLVMHLGPAFAAPFAEWLDGLSTLRVRYAVDREQVPRGEPGCVILAPPDRHLVVQGQRLVLTNDPERHSCRPSVDTLFESVAREYGSSAVGCLLTGMGRDGAEGLKAMRMAGGVTIAQDEASSVVFGMPREAIALDAAQRILSLDQIASALNALCPERQGRRNP